MIAGPDSHTSGRKIDGAWVNVSSVVLSNGEASEDRGDD